MTNQEKIDLIGVLSRGYAKPDLSACCSDDRTVHETKDYRPYIFGILEDLMTTSKIKKHKETRTKYYE